MRTTLWQGLFPTSLCISAIDGGQMEDDCRDAGGRATQGAVAEIEPRREQRSRSGRHELVLQFRAPSRAL